ncbi:gustatory receptor for sugar taste 64e-like [Centruroides sculpturatus]|uniref:gustatory receptor for sugar taste 64e-like n=1 Tax=Centruroides sculpturatus TaxID=218467 RepID=UPI000C6EF86B|nr:gustatory receptor for sugar taste 64e-like [Centruroides sculpturatus]
MKAKILELAVQSSCPEKDCLKCFECLFQPVLKILSITGMYGCFSDQKKNTPEEELINKRRMLLGKALNMCLWAYFGRCFLLMFTFIPGFYHYVKIGWIAERFMYHRKPALSPLVIVASYFFRCATISGMFNKPSKPSKTRKSLAVLWEEVKATTAEHRQTEFDLSHMERALAFGVYPFMIFASMAFTLPYAYTCYSHLAEKYGFALAMLSTLPMLGVHFISYGIWLSSVLCFVVISTSLTKRFVEVTRDLIRMQQSPEPGVTGDLDGVQLKHHKMCNVVQAADRLFQSYLFCSYVMFIPETCYGLFQLIFITRGATYQLYLGWMVAVGLATFLSLSLTAASVSGAAHSCQGPIRGLSVKDLTLDQHVKITMFLERLSGPTIGLSCLDLFVVTKGVVLSVASAVVTYFLIFVQFNSDDSK